MKQIANPGESITSGYNYSDTVTKSFKRATDEEYEAIKSTLTSDNIVSGCSSCHWNLYSEKLLIDTSFLVSTSMNLSDSPLDFA